MYQLNTVYIWQNQVGKYAVLNGTETTVLGGPYQPDENDEVVWWETNTLPPDETDPNEWFMTAYVGDLRPKDPPSGEKSILELFTLPVLEPA